MSTIFDDLMGVTFGEINAERDGVTRLAYSPDQSRDDSGKFGEGGGGAPVILPYSLLPDPPSLALVAAASAYQGSLAETKATRMAADLLVQNKPNADSDGMGRARELLHAIERSDPTTQDLYRGMVVDTPGYVAGESVEFAIGSFSSDKSWAEGFALMGAFNTGVAADRVRERGIENPGPVMFKLEPGARALSIDMLAQPTSARTEHEYVTGGRFEVASVDRYGPIGSEMLGTSDGQLVTLRQTEVVSVP